MPSSCPNPSGSLGPAGPPYPSPREARSRAGTGTGHADKWVGPTVPAFCDPRVSALIVQTIAHRAISRYGAKNAWDIQAVFAGRFECVGLGNGKTCTGAMQDRTYNAICSRMKRRGFDCHDPITVEDLGPKIPLRERREWISRK